MIARTWLSKIRVYKSLFLLQNESEGERGLRKRILYEHSSSYIIRWSWIMAFYFIFKGKDLEVCAKDTLDCLSIGHPGPRCKKE